MMKTKTFLTKMSIFCRKRNVPLMSMFGKNPLKKADQASKTNENLRFHLHD